MSTTSCDIARGPEMKRVTPKVFVGDWTVVKVTAFDDGNWLHRQPAVQLGDGLHIEYARQHDSGSCAKLQSSEPNLETPATPTVQEIKETVSSTEIDKIQSLQTDVDSESPALRTERANGPKFVVINQRTSIRWDVIYSLLQHELWENIFLPSSAAIDRALKDGVDKKLRVEVLKTLNENSATKLSASDLPTGNSAADWKNFLKRSAYEKNPLQRGVVEIGVLNIKYLGRSEVTGKRRILGVIVNRFNHPGCEWHAED